METKITINGMHCDACKRLIEKRISSIPGVTRVVVEPATGKTSVIAERTITPDELRASLTGTEYTIA